jgi:hypothetical protein
MFLAKCLALLKSRRFLTAVSTIIGIVLADVFGLDLGVETIIGIVSIVGAWIYSQTKRPTTPIDGRAGYQPPGYIRTPLGLLFAVGLTLALASSAVAQAAPVQSAAGATSWGTGVTGGAVVRSSRVCQGAAAGCFLEPKGSSK